MRIAEQFTDIFREEHRDVRDLLFSLIDMFRAGDTARARTLVSAMATATGPHFRYTPLEQSLDLLTWADTVRGHHV